MCRPSAKFAGSSGRGCGKLWINMSRTLHVLGLGVVCLVLFAACRGRAPEPVAVPEEPPPAPAAAPAPPSVKESAPPSVKELAPAPKAEAARPKSQPLRRALLIGVSHSFWLN